MPTRERPARKARLQAEAAIAKLNTGGKGNKGRNTTPGGTKPSTRAQAEQVGEPHINQPLAQQQQELAGHPEANPPQLMRGGDGKDDAGDKGDQKEEEASTAPLPEKVGCFALGTESTTNDLISSSDPKLFLLHGHANHKCLCEEISWHICIILSLFDHFVLHVCLY